MKQETQDTTTFDMHEVYVRSGQEFVPYMGGPNFLNGIMKCPYCKERMERVPLNQSYLTTKGGKILVNTHGFTGRLILSNAEPDYHWACKNCGRIVSHAKE